MPRRTFTRQSRGSGRKSLWLTFVPTVTTVATNTTAVLVASLNAAALALRPFTIVRTYLEMWLKSDQAGAVELQTISLGMAVVLDPFSVVGVTAIPTPTTDSGSSLWFVHRYLFGSETAFVDNQRPAASASIDSKAMRKVDEGQDIVLAVEGGGTGSGMIVTVGGRVLIKTN